MMAKAKKRIKRKYKVDPARSAQMARVKGRGTGPEIIVQRLVDDIGYRYQTHVRALSGNPDLIFMRLHKIIFVHGCFWHQHSRASCWRSRIPKTRQEFWIPKLKANVARDRACVAKLRKERWKVLIIWECNTTAGQRERLRARIEKFLAA
jgi:DNA mismatch endonuclease (patch repair protein)